MPLDKGSERKLRRGLEDLSPLFRNSMPGPVEENISLHPSFDVQFLTVCVPDHEGDAFLANAYLASQMVRQANLYASLVSVVPGFNVFPPKVESLPFLELLDPRISRLTVSHQELWTLTQKDLNGKVPQSFRHQVQNTEPLMIFLEFEPAQFRSLARIAPLLDRVIFFVQPQVESLREAYRLIKIFWSLNRTIEFFLLFRGRIVPCSRGEFLFERFSLIVSRFLGISIEWLGDLAFPEKNEPAWIPGKDTFHFSPDVILGNEGLRRPLAIEQSRLRSWLEKILQSRFLHEQSA